MSKQNKIIRVVQDKILITKTKAGKLQAYSRIYTKYFNNIYKFVYFKVSSKETAEDLTADTFLKVWRYINNGKNVDNIRALLYSTARNIVIDYYRKNKDLYLDDRDKNDLILDNQNIDANIDLVDNIAQLKSALMELKEDQREIIILKYMHGMSYKEIGEVVGKRPGSVRMAAHRALKELRRILGGKN